MPEAIPTAGEGTTQVVSNCYKCGALLAPDATNVCPACGRRQTRQCFCGATISRGPVVCPRCGADWSLIRRRSRSSKKPIDTRELLLNAFLGGLGAVALAGLLYFLLTGGAQRLLEAISSTVSGAWPRVSQVASYVAAPVAVFLVGCLFGVGRYCVIARSRSRARGKRQPRRRSKER